MTDPVWINGAFDGRVDPLDRGLTLGDGVFDTLVAFRRIAFAADRHLARLVWQAGAIGIPVDPATIRAGWEAVLGRAQAEHVIVRTTVTRGVTGRALWPDSPSSPNVIVSALPWNAELFARPARLVTGTIRRNASSPASRLKSLGYLDHVLAAREALDKGASDALFINHSGKVACTTIANVFVVRGARLVTPPVADGVMPGIMRALVLEAAGRLGIHAEEASLTREDVAGAEAAFLTNSVRFLAPLDSLDGEALRRADMEVIGKLTDAIADQVSTACGFDPRRPA
jgi:branched-chain amino acid aminotransferase